jgi:hypothetical protein
LDARTLSGRLALLDATESLSVVAETLAAAAIAMSKAAESLAAASEYLDTERNYKKPDRYDSDKDAYESPSPISSPLWQQSYYTLPANNKLQETGEFCGLAYGSQEIKFYCKSRYPKSERHH